MGHRADLGSCPSETHHRVSVPEMPAVQGPEAALIVGFSNEPSGPRGGWSRKGLQSQALPPPSPPTAPWASANAQEPGACSPAHTEVKKGPLAVSPASPATCHPICRHRSVPSTYLTINLVITTWKESQRLERYLLNANF